MGKMHENAPLLGNSSGDFDVSQEVGKVVLECSNSTIVGVSYNRVPQSGWFIGEHPKIFHG